MPHFPLRPRGLLAVVLVLGGASADHCAFDLQASGERTKGSGDECSTEPDGTVVCVDRADAGQVSSPPDASTPVIEDPPADTPDAGVGINVIVSPAKVILGPKMTAQFKATVEGTSSNAVFWKLKPEAESSKGSISLDGLYTAADTMIGVEPLLVTVQAFSIADATRVGEATVEVRPFGVQLTPASAHLNPAKQQQFSASLTGLNPPGNSSVYWTVVEPNGGVIDQNGLYTAPIGTGVFHVQANSFADLQIAARARVTVNNGTLLNVTVLPSKTTLVHGQSTSPVTIGDRLRFSAEVGTGGADQTVIWALEDNDGEATIDADGLFQAVGADADGVTVRATSVADPSKSGTATVRIVSPSGLYRVHGTVKYTGTLAGPLYVRASGYMEGTTVVDPAIGESLSSSLGVPFVIRGTKINSGEDLELVAYVDTLGTGIDNTLSNPRTTHSASELSQSAIHVGQLTLSGPPSPVSPTVVPDSIHVTTHNDGAIIQFDEVTNGDDPAVTHYRVYAAMAPYEPGPGGQNFASWTVRTGAPNIVVTPALPAGTYKFGVSTLIGDLETSIVKLADGTYPIPASPSSGQYSVQGQVSVVDVITPGSATPGRVVVTTGFEMNGLMAGLTLNGASPTGTFNLLGATNGWYRLNAILDRNNDGEIGPTDLFTFPIEPGGRDSRLPFAVSGTNVIRNETLHFSREPAIIRLSTGREKFDGSTDHFAVELGVQSNTSHALKASIVGAPNVTWLSGTAPSFPADLAGLDEVFRLGQTDQNNPPYSSTPWQVEVLFLEGGRLVTRTWDVPSAATLLERPALTNVGVAGPLSSVHHEGTSSITNLALTTSGEPVPGNYDIEIVTGGAETAATFRWRPSPEAPYSEATSLTTIATALEGTNILVQFPAGTYDQGDVYSFDTCANRCVGAADPVTIQWTQPLQTPPSYHYRLLVSEEDHRDPLVMQVGGSVTSHALPSLPAGNYTVRLELVGTSGSWAADELVLTKVRF